MICDGTGSCGHSPCPHELATQGRIDIIIQEQGWNDETIKELTWQFIGEKRLYEEFTNYLEQRAKEENEEE